MVAHLGKLETISFPDKWLPDTSSVRVFFGFLFFVFSLSRKNSLAGQRHLALIGTT